MSRMSAVIAGWMVFTVAAAWAAPDEQWEKYRSARFEIFYKAAPESFVEEVSNSAEDYYEKIIEELGFVRYNNWTYDNRAKIYIYDDRDDYLQSARQSDWSHGVAFTSTKIIRTFPSAHGFFDSTLPHELGHIIFRDFIGFRARLPVWMEEGVAMYVEKAKRWGADARVRAAMEDGRFMTLKELSRVRLTSDLPRDTVELYYAEAASVMNYLISEYGRGRFFSFCDYLRDGKPLDDALRIAYRRFENIADLNEGWTEFLNRGK